MRRQSQEQVAAAAQRRLELLARELDQAGLRRVGDAEVPAGPVPDPDSDPAWGPDSDPAWDPASQPRSDPGPVGSATVAPVGRHLRPAPPGPVRRWGAWVGDLVPETLRGRIELGPGPVLLVVTLVALALTATAYVVLRSGGDAQAVRSELSAPSGSPTAMVSLRPPQAAASTAPTGDGGRVTVDVAGKVRRPMVATLPAGSRVVDALRKAGGARRTADLTALNLARVLVDGEQILVGDRPPPGGLAARASTAAPDPTGALVSLNTASADQLDTLPGVGPVTAQKILEWRAAHGAFSSVDELLEVDGIGPKTFADLAPHVTL